MEVENDSYAKVNDLVQQADALRDRSQYLESLPAYSAAIDIMEQRAKLDATSGLDGNWRKLLGLAYNNRGFVKYMRVDFDDAIEDYTRALNIEDSPIYRYNRGLINYRLAQFDDAVRDMQAALMLDSSFECARKCLEQSKRDKEAQLLRALAERNQPSSS